MGWAQVAAVLASHAQRYDVIGLEWVIGRGCSTAQVADGVGREDAITFFPVATGVRVGSCLVGVASMLTAA